ncbi:MAG: hypothetical protein ACM37W_02215 [Actinomycetota bacterium]
MANLEHLKILGQGAEVWNAWRKSNPQEIPDLSAAHISSFGLITSFNNESVESVEIDEEADLKGINLSGTNMRG